jgi:site-specific recombinase
LIARLLALWRRRSGAWDLSALLNAADASASRAERHLWLVRMLEWLRHAPLPNAHTPTPVLRLRHALNVLSRNPQYQAQVAALLSTVWHDLDLAALLADFGFPARMDMSAELGQRVRRHLLPTSPDTVDLSELFNLLFPAASDADWLDALDADTLSRLLALLGPPDAGTDWRAPFIDALTFLTSAVGTAGFSSLLRKRMSPELLATRPFRQLVPVAERLREHAEAGDEVALAREAQYLRALLDTCRRCADSVHDHLEEHGVSVDVVFELDQLRRRTVRIEAVLNCVLSPTPPTEVTRLLAELVRVADERRSVRALFATHYSMLARKVAERSAETGEHYITRDRAAYRQMLRQALGGGFVIAVTLFVKFFLAALGLSAFWTGFVAGANYAGSFVLIHLLHWTVATKQPAMTAPAMAEKLADVADDEAVEGFVDEVANLIRSQAAGILGNLVMVIPVVLVVQLAVQAAFGTAVAADKAGHILDSLSLLGPTAFYAAFTGVLLFASSLIAGWVENWFVWHRLDSAIAWNPRIVGLLGAGRAQRWAQFWRNNISGLASNTSLGFMLGLVPVLATFFGLPLDVRHVTLSTGQIAAAAAAIGPSVLHDSAFWWAVAVIPFVGALNLGVSFFLAFKVALRSRGIRLNDRSRIHRAIRRRLWRRPMSFIIPPREPVAPSVPI